MAVGIETGYRYIKNYSYREYDHFPQNWHLVQAENGIIYAANTAGVLEYDGVSWRVIGVPGYDMASSIAIDRESGIIYVGGKDKIGYLAADAQGELRYKPLHINLEEKKKKLGKIYSIHILNKSTFFRAERFLFNKHAERIVVIPTPNYFIASFVCFNDLYIQQLKVGIMRFKNSSLELIPGGDFFANIKVSMMIPFDIRSDGEETFRKNADKSSELLIGTYFKGLFLYDGKRVYPFTIEKRLDNYLKKNWITHGIRLKGGDIALATRRGGIVIMTAEGRTKNIYDKQSGLQDNNVKHLMEDKQGNLWAALNNGISRIEMQSPFSLYDNRVGLPGTTHSILRYGSDLYVGTSEGLYVLKGQEEVFRPASGVVNSCWNLVSTGNSILAGTSVGIHHIPIDKDSGNDKKNRQLLKKELPVYALLPSRKFPGRTWCGTGSGLIVLDRRSNRWNIHRFKNISEDIGSLVETDNGDLWLGGRNRGVLRASFRGPDSEPTVTRFGKKHGLPDGSVYVTKAAGHIMLATRKGIYRFDNQSTSFVPDYTLGTNYAGVSTTNSKDVGGTPVFRIVEDKNQNIWFHSQSRNYLAIPGQGGSFEIESTSFRRIPFSQVHAIYPDPDGSVTWFAGSDGLIRYDNQIRINPSQPFPALIRKVLVNENERLIFYGAQSHLPGNVKNFLVVLPHNERNLHFEFAAPYYEKEEETEYRCFLEGNDKDWTKWSKEHKRYYTNLGADHYTFRVEARNIYLHKGTEGRFHFLVLPPWYRTWWAYLIYAIVAGLAVFGIVQWRSFKLVQDKRKLEAIIRDRTHEIKTQSDQLKEQTIQLRNQSEELKEMDRVKSRFFANISHEFRTPLTLIMSPLEQMLSESGREKGEKKRLNVMLRSSQRLLTLINKLLDLARFDSGEEGLKASCYNIVPFVKNISESFYQLANQNQLTLGFKSDRKEINVYFDAPKMEEVLYNLFINAVKFTTPGGRISVTISVSSSLANEEPLGQLEEENKLKARGFVEISVRDTGCGIPNEQLPHIFDRFYKSRGLIKEKVTKGTGLGLALTREIVNLHQGKIDVHSQEGRGTEFVIQLPLGHVHLKAHEIILRSEAGPDRKRSNELNVLAGTEGEEWSEENRQEEPKTEKPKTVILVVEDEVDVRKYICEPLRKEYQIVEASDGKEGIEKAKTIIPDLIVSDIMMPETDGYELCRELKKNFDTSHIPIILLTAKASDKSMLRGLEGGADDYITKPFNVQMLLARIRNLIDLRRQLQLKIQRQKMLLPAEIEVSSQDDEFLKEMQAIIEQNLSDPDFDIKVLQEKLFIGRTTLFRKVEALTGDTPNQFLQSYRLERGARLLRENFGNVTDVAMEVGFDSPQYFATCFKKKYHQSPSSYQATESKA